MDLLGVEPRSNLVPRAAFQAVETFQTLSVATEFESVRPLVGRTPMLATNPPTRRRALELFVQGPLTESPKRISSSKGSG